MQLWETAISIDSYMLLKVLTQEISEEVRYREMKRQKNRAPGCHRGQRGEKDSAIKLNRGI